MPRRTGELLMLKQLFEKLIKEFDDNIMTCAICGNIGKDMIELEDNGEVYCICQKCENNA